MGTDGRDYLGWSSNRGNSGERLDRIPSITTIANGTRYYSSVDAELFFGDIYIGEITDIVWQVSQNTLPLYGYNSYCFDDVALGTRIIQGQFSINFTEANYLERLQKDSAFAKIARRQYGIDFVQESVYSDYRRRLNLPKWDAGFDIVVGFGYHQTKIGKIKNNDTSSYTVLDCCQITGSSIRLNYEGRPVEEVYSFIARDVKEARATEAEYNPAENNSTTGDISNKVPPKIRLSGELDLANSVINIRSENKVDFINTGTVRITYSFKNKQLNSEFNLSKKNGALEAELPANIASGMKQELSGKGMSKVSADVYVSYTLDYENTFNRHETKGTVALTLVL